jgi:hypothetical protein
LVPRGPERRANPRRATLRSEIARLRRRSQEILEHLDELVQRIEHIEEKKASVARPKK